VLTFDFYYGIDAVNPGTTNPVQAMSTTDSCVRARARGVVRTAILLVASSLLSIASAAPAAPSANDLWDVSGGITITATSGIRGGFAAEDMFGATASFMEPSDTIFADGDGDGFVHFIEWQTPSPVTVGSVALFAVGDGPTYNNEREFDRFVLKVRSPGSAAFDQVIYEYSASHPYVFVDPASYALVLAPIPAVTAQAFRAEFVQRNAGRGYDGPRILELDAFPPDVITSNCVASPPGLVSWWQAEGTAVDTLGANHGTASSGVGFAPGMVGQAFRFDGLGQVVRIPASPTLDLGAGDALSIEGWIKLDSATAIGPLAEWNDPSKSRIGAHFWINVEYPPGSQHSLFANLVDLHGNSHIVATGPGVLKDTEWHHVALTYDKNSGLGVLFLDAVAVQTENLGAVTPATSYDLWFGGRVSGDAFLWSYRGLHDEFSLYRRALAGSEIQAIYRAGSAGKCPPTPPSSSVVADWTFEEGTPDAAVTSVGDSSGNGHVGSIILGNPTFAASPPSAEAHGDVSLALGANSGFRPEDSPAFNLGDAFTIEAQMLPGANNDGPWKRYVIGGFDPATGASILGLGYQGDVGVSMFGDAAVNIPRDGASHHLAVTYSRPTVSLYLDGQLAGTTSIELLFPAAGSPVRITVGCDSSGGFWFGGLIDRARISNRALKPSEFFGAAAPPAFNDGIPDSWRQQHFGGGFATDPRAAATADPDGDGANNYQEYLAGTDPLSASSVQRVPVSVSTYAGSTRGAQDGFRTEARFNYLPGFTFDGAGRLWIPETSALGYDQPGEGSHRIRLLDTNGMVSVLTGAEAGLVEGPLEQARFSGTMGVVFDSRGNAFVLDMFNHRVRKIDTNGVVSTFAGSTRGYRDGPALEAQFDVPHGIAIDALDNLFLADWFNLRIRKITPGGEVSTFSGSTRGAQDGPRLQATYDGPVDLVIDPAGVMYVSDWANGRIRKIDTNGEVSTFVSGLSYTEMLSLGSDGAVYCYAAGLRQFNKYSPTGDLLWSWSTPEGSEDGPIGVARFGGRLTKGIELPDGGLLVGEDARIRLITTGVAPLITLSPAGGVFTNAVGVTVTTIVPNGVIRYTTDSSAPTAGSTAYAGPLSFSVTTVLKSQVFVNGTPVSAVTVAEFIRAVDDSQPPTIALTSPVAGPTSDERFELTGTVTDNVRVASARWEWNGEPQGPLPLVSGRFSVPGLRLKPGDNRIRVLATDAAGNEAAAEIVATWTPARVLALVNPPGPQEGQTLTVPIALISSGDVGGVNFVLRYDADYLRALDCEWSPVVGSAFNMVKLDQPGEVRGSFALFGVTVPAGTQTVAELTFHVRSVPSTLTTDLRLELVDVSDPAGNSMAFGNAALSGSVQIQVRRVVGDNNANDLLDVGDATVIQRFLTGLEVQRDWDRTGNDVNSNGNLDGGDVIRVLRAVVGLDPQPQPAGGGLVKTARAGTGLWKRDGAPAGLAVLTPRALRAQPGDLVTFQLRLQDLKTPVSGASFRLDYPTNALRLLSSQAHRAGALVPGGAVAAWNVTPAQNNYAVQDGRLAFGASSASPWPSQNGVLAEFTFEVQAAQVDRYAWPIRVSGLEITADGYDMLRLADAETVFVGRDPQPPDLGADPGSFVGGRFELRLTGEPGTSFLIEATTDFKTWWPIATLPNPDGILHFADPAAAGLGHRFYRATLLPIQP
jgi:hypothetical protein